MPALPARHSKPRTPPCTPSCQEHPRHTATGKEDRQQREPGQGGDWDGRACSMRGKAMEQMLDSLDTWVSQRGQKAPCQKRLTGGGGGGGGGGGDGHNDDDGDDADDEDNDDEDDCAICACSMRVPRLEQVLDSLDTWVVKWGQKLTIQLGSIWRHPVCGHRFHQSCIEEWSKHKHNCPLCRSGQIHRLNLQLPRNNLYSLMQNWHEIRASDRWRCF